MSVKVNSTITVMDIDIGKNSFHVVGHNKRGAITLPRSGRAGRWRHGWPTCRRV
jgi:transposase